MVLSIDIVMVWMRFIYTHRLIYLQAQSHNWWAVREGLGDVALQRMYVTNSGLWHFKSACRAQYFPLLSSCCLWIRMENSQLLLQHHACCHDNELPLWNCIQSPQLNAFLFFFFCFWQELPPPWCVFTAIEPWIRQTYSYQRKEIYLTGSPPRDKQIQTTAARGRLVCPRSEALPDYLTQRGQPRNHAHTTKAVDCIYILRIYINMCVTVISKEKEAIILRVRCLSGERL